MQDNTPQYNTIRTDANKPSTMREYLKAVGLTLVMRRFVRLGRAAGRRVEGERDVR